MEPSSILSEVIGKTSEPLKEPILTPKAVTDFNEKAKRLTEKTKTLIYWSGLICTIISAFAYVLITVIMIYGFKAEGTWQSNLAFSLIAAFIGVLIANFLRLQGVTFAKNEPEIKAVYERFYSRKSKNRRYHSLTFYWARSIVFDVLFKAVSVSVVMFGAVYIFVDASGDVMRVLLAIFNLTFFIGFGMVALSTFYDIIKRQHVAWMEHKMEQEKAEEAKTDNAESGEKERLAPTSSIT